MDAYQLMDHAAAAVAAAIVRNNQEPVLNNDVVALTETEPVIGRAVNYSRPMREDDWWDAVGNRVAKIRRGQDRVLERINAKKRKVDELTHEIAADRLIHRMFAKEIEYLETTMDEDKLVELVNDEIPPEEELDEE